MPTDWAPAAAALPQQLQGALFVTVHPEHVATAALETVDQLVAVGADPAATIRCFCNALAEAPPPEIEDAPLEEGFAYLWARKQRRLQRVCAEGPKQAHRRHIRKYAEGEIGVDRSFYFRGPDSRLNLRAQNLQLFLQIADGVDNATWLHHLRGGDYSQWIKDSLKDSELAAEIAAIEQNDALDVKASRASVKEAIDRRYTATA
ncbi:MAG: phosphoglycolate phosphatase, partial [Roseiarcus sp.]